MEEEVKKRDYLLPASILISAILVSSALVYNVGKKSAGEIADNGKTSSDFDLTDVVFLGDSKAPLTLIEYGDYQCPFCIKFFEETEPLIKKEFVDTGRVKMVYKDLAFLGPESLAAALAARCAADQGKFWEYHNALFEEEAIEDRSDDGIFNGSSENSGNLNKQTFLRLAENLGLNTQIFTDCFDSKKHQARIEKDLAEAQTVMSRVSTPTFFVVRDKDKKTQMIQGALPYQTFKEAIEELLR